MSQLSDLMSQGMAAYGDVADMVAIISPTCSKMCIPSGITKNMKQVTAGYEIMATPSVEMSRSDFSALAVNMRDSVNVQVSRPGEALETVELVIHQIESDPADDWVRLILTIEP